MMGMFTVTLKRFQALRPPVRSLVALYWLYVFTMSLTWVFLQILLYSRFAMLSLNIIASLALYSGVMIGFCVFGYLASLWQVNIKHGFLWSFLMLAIGFVVLLRADTPILAYAAVLLDGIGQGFFWLTIHTFELYETQDRERDFYSSLLSVGDQVFSLVGPAAASALIWASDTLLHRGPFTLVFAVTPALYLLGFFVFPVIRDYRPKPIRWGDVTHFFADRRNSTFQVYVLGEGAQHVLGMATLPLVSLAILGSALGVGLFDTVVGAFSILCILALAGYRTSENRLAILAGASLVLAASVMWLGYEFTLGALVFFTVVQALAVPFMNVSNHVISLQGMESMGRPGSDFYATMVLRDFALWFWRMVVGTAFLLVASELGVERLVLGTGLFWIAGALIVTLFGAELIIRNHQKAPEHMMLGATADPTAD